MLNLLIVVGGMALVTRWVAYRLPTGFRYSALAVVIGIVVGPILGILSGVVLAFASQAHGVTTPGESLLAGMSMGLLGAILSFAFVPWFRRQRRKEDAVAWKYR